MKIKKFNELSNWELYEILKARIQIFSIEQNCICQDCDGKDKYGYHLFITEDERVIGYLRILPKGISFKEVSIGRVLVVDQHRKNGLARLMMKKAIEWIKNDLNEDSIRISSQEHLIEFYKSLGFETVSDVHLEVGRPHVGMLYK